ncbi:hypothetical protein FRC05_001666 [Tulasnella sp. 425]|nr:hypothetical protein FRC05_001666 [Tulasnella sp. 425]
MAPTTPITNAGTILTTPVFPSPTPPITLSLDEPTLILAIVNTLAFRFEKLSVSEEVDSTVSPIATMEAPVHTATSMEPTDFVTVKDSGQRKRLVQMLLNKLKDHSKRIKSGLKKAFPKYSKAKKARGCIAPNAEHCLPSQCLFAEDEDKDVGQITQVLGGLSISDAIKATDGPKFHGMFTVEIWRSLATIDPNMAQLCSSISSSTVAVTPTRGNTNTKIMDEDFLLQVSPHPTSPAVTAVEHGSPQSPSPKYPSSTSPAMVATIFMDGDIPAQGPLCPTSSVTTFQDLESATSPSDMTLGPEQYMGRKEERDILEPKDTDMAEKESRPNSIEVVQQPQNDGSNMEVDLSSTPDPSSDSNESTILLKALTPEVTMEDATGSQRVNPPNTPPGSSSALPIQPAPSSPDIDAGPTSHTAQDLVPATTSNATALRQETQLAQPLPVSMANGAMEPESPPEGDFTRELDARERQVVPIEPSLPATTPNPTPEPIATPPSTPTHLHTGPSTGSSSKQGPVPTSHAARVHQVQAKMREAKSASKLVLSPANDEASEEAEVDDFLAKYNLGHHCRPVKLLPPPPAPISKPKQSKGDASRSLMSDLIAGFTSVIQPMSSGKQHQEKN